MTSLVADRLRIAFVAAYRPYVESLLAERGLPEVGDAVDEGERWLDTALADLLALPFPDQARSPLEVFQEALAFPTEALQARDVAPAERDAVAESALPGDRYDLAPASSQSLGEDAWRAHLEWGAAKAARLGPLAVLFSRNLLDSSRIEEAAARAGFRVSTVRDFEGLPAGGSVIAFVDLEHHQADDAVRTLAATSGRVIAYGPHVDDQAMLRARSLGADDALARSRFFKSPADHFPTIA